jgi:hypothetical protein
MRRVVAAPVAAAAACLLLVSTACSAPPQKEIDRAQGAIDAARAAGAEQYAPEPFAAATTAMQQTHEAVEQRDYRLALSRAIDANDRALEAARQAASGKAQARSEAEALLTRTTASVRQLEAQLKAAVSARVPAAATQSARHTLADAERALQEARAAAEREDYPAAMKRAQGWVEKISGEIQTLNEALEAKGTRTRRRR